MSIHSSLCRENRVLQVTIKQSTDEPTTDGDTTPVELDISETVLITACGRKHSTLTRPVLWSDRRAKHLRKEMSTTLLATTGTQCRLAN